MQVDIGAHGQALGHFLRAFDGEDLFHLLHGGGHDERLQAGRLGGLDADRRFDIADVIVVLDVALLEHLLERGVAAPLGFLRIDARRRTGGRADDPGQQRAFRHGHVDGLLAEVTARRRSHPEVPLPEINPVEVIVHDLVLGQMLLEPDRDEGLEEFPVHRAGEIADEVLGQLLLDRAAPLHAARFLGEVLPQGPQNAPIVDRAMLVKPAVFRGHHRLAHGLGNFVGLEDDAVFDKNAAQFLAVDIVKRRGDVEIVELLQVVGLGPGVINQRLFVGEIAQDAPQDNRHDQANLDSEPELAPKRPLLFRRTAGSAGAARLRAAEPARRLQRGGGRLLGNGNSFGRFPGGWSTMWAREERGSMCLATSAYTTTRRFLRRKNITSDKRSMLSLSEGPIQVHEPRLGLTPLRQVR